MNNLQSLISESYSTSSFSEAEFLQSQIDNDVAVKLIKEVSADSTAIKLRLYSKNNKELCEAVTINIPQEQYKKLTGVTFEAISSPPEPYTPTPIGEKSLIFKFSNGDIIVTHVSELYNKISKLSTSVNNLSLAIAAEITRATTKDDLLNNAIESEESSRIAADNLLQQSKQDKIDEENKLSSDLISDTNKINKFVTTEEKSTWTAKQEALPAGNNDTYLHKNATTGNLEWCTATIESDVFFATYNITTYSEIKAAFDSNKIIILHYSNNNIPLLVITDSLAKFIATFQDKIVQCSIDSSDTWIVAESTIVNSVNNKSGLVNITADDVNAVEKNAAITGATHTKITYDTKGLITSGAELTEADIPDLAASKITSGILSIEHIPELTASKITSGVFDTARIPELSTDKITSGKFTDEYIESAETWNETKSTLTTHINNESNPHSVNKAQVGLGNVGNFKAVSTEADQNLTDTEKVNARTNIGAEKADITILKQANIIDNVTSTSTISPLSANQGKVLQTEIDNLKSIGRFLAVLNAENGTVSSQPSGNIGDTYAYRVGDYYRIGGNGNYCPKATIIYTIDSNSGSSNFELSSNTFEIGDVLYCSNITETASTWVKQKSSGGGTVQDVQINSISKLSGGIVNLLEDTTPTSGSSNLITSGGVFNSLPTEQTITNWGFTKNVGTVTNVAVGTGLTVSGVSSVSPTIEINTNYKLPTVSEWESKLTSNTEITGATHTKITYDSKGLVISGADLSASDIPDLSTEKITSGKFADEYIESATTWNEKYEKPSAGIPKTDLAEEVQNSLTKADTALQSHQDISGKADKSNTVTNVAYDTTNKKITKTIDGSISDVVSVTALKTDMLLNNVVNTGDSETPVSGGTTKFTTGGAFTELAKKVTANNAITGSTKCKITYDSKGLITEGADLTADDLPAHNHSIIQYGDGSSTSIKCTNEYISLNTSKGISLSAGSYSSVAYDGIFIDADENGINIDAGKDISLTSAEEITFEDNYNSVSLSDLANKQQALTTAQLDACNSGITSSKVSSYDGYEQSKENKGKITVNSTEKTVKTHTITVVTNGVTSTFTVLGI